MHPVQVVHHGILRHQDLGGRLIIFREKLLIDHHQPRLAHSGTGLLHLQFLRSLFQPQHGGSHRHSAGGDQDHVFALIVEIAELPHKDFHLPEVQSSCFSVDQGGRPHLHHDTFFIFQ